MLTSYYVVQSDSYAVLIVEVIEFAKSNDFLMVRRASQNAPKLICKISIAIMRSKPMTQKLAVPLHVIVG